MTAWLLFHLRRALRPGRDRLIARQMREFLRINPELHGDIGLRPHSFRDAAEAIADAQLALWAAQDAAARARLSPPSRHRRPAAAPAAVPPAPERSSTPA